MKNLKKLAAIIVLIIFSFMLLIDLTIYKGCYLKTGYGKIEMGNGNLLNSTNGFIFDTGANCSYISKRIVNFPILLFPIILSDTNGSMGLSFVYYGRSVSINDSISIHNLSFIRILKRDSTHKHFEAIIGMDVISKINMYLSFCNNEIEIMPIDSIPDIPSDAVRLYYEGTTSPEVSLNIGDIVTDNILVDTGLDDDIALNVNILKQLIKKNNYNYNIKNNKTLFGAHKQKNYFFRKLSINSVEYNDVTILQSKKNLLGMSFFRRFNHMFWSSKEKTIFLWY